MSDAVENNFNLERRKTGTEGFAFGDFQFCE